MKISQGFSIRDGVSVVIQCDGVYSQRQIYKMGRQLYAKIGNGYIALHSSGNTSKPKAMWKHFVCDGVDVKESFSPSIEGYYVVETDD